LQKLLTGILIFFFCSAAFAQGPSEPIPGEPVPASPVVAVLPASVPDTPSAHTRFWDKRNILLASGVAGTTALDFAATQRNLSGPSGGTEYNPLARVFTGSTPGRVAYFSGAAAGTIGLSYLFHKTGHHRLERTTLMIGIGCSTQGAVYSFLHH
jgi:hypothetical protein